MRRVVLLSGLVLTLLLGAAAGEKNKQYSDLNFVVVKESNGRPVRAASVVLHPVNAKGKQESSGLQLKTDNDGKAEFHGAPYGKLRVQVIAPGFQTYGEDFEIKQPQHEFTIKLAKPKEQLSIYK